MYSLDNLQIQHVTWLSYLLHFSSLFSHHLSQSFSSFCLSLPTDSSACLPPKLWDFPRDLSPKPSVFMPNFWLLSHIPTCDFDLPTIDENHQVCISALAFWSSGHMDPTSLDISIWMFYRHVTLNRCPSGTFRWELCPSLTHKLPTPSNLFIPSSLHLV